MSGKHVVFHLVLDLFQKGLHLLGQRKRALIAAGIVETITPIMTIKTDIGNIRFFCPGKRTVWRANTLLTKEPDTIEWINAFDTQDVFWDIGANVGNYSIYAAFRGIDVLAFEPSSANYYAFNKNLEINKIDEKVNAFCIAFNDISTIDKFYMPLTEPGGALSSFAQKTDWQGNDFLPKFKQAMVGFSIDDFIERFDPLFPNHIKIDVDGIEDRIIAGAMNTLADKRLKSLLVELDTNDTEYCSNIISIMERSGLTLETRNMASHPGKSSFSSVYNHIFVRK